MSQIFGTIVQTTKTIISNWAFIKPLKMFLGVDIENGFTFSIWN
jgi:hypothetical protein